MNYAPTLKLAGNSPNGNKLIAKFPGPVYPEQIQIKGSADSNGLSGNSGNWVSNEKYPSAAVTLQLIVGGVVVMEVAYSANGNITTPDAAITGFNVVASNGSAVISFSSTTEINLSYYAVDRKLTSESTYTPGIQTIYPTGAGSSYSMEDVFINQGNYDFRLRAVFIDGTDKVLGEKNASNTLPPNAAITGFGITSAGGGATLVWKSTIEISVEYYAIDRKLSSASSYDPGVQIVFPTGVNSDYSFEDVPFNPGTYDYQLRAVFSDTTDKILATGSATI